MCKAILCKIDLTLLLYFATATDDKKKFCWRTTLRRLTGDKSKEGEEKKQIY